MIDDTAKLIRSLTKPQRSALDQIATDRPPRASRKVLQALESRGLIVGIPRESKDRFGLMTWTEYAMPLNVHIVWCEVASAEYDALSPEEKAEASR